MSHGQLLVQIHRWEILPSGWGKGSGTEYCVSIGYLSLLMLSTAAYTFFGSDAWSGRRLPVGVVAGMKGAPKNDHKQPSNTTSARRTALRVFWTDGLLQSCCRRYIIEARKSTAANRPGCQMPWVTARPAITLSVCLRVCQIGWHSLATLISLCQCLRRDWEGEVVTFWKNWRSISDLGNLPSIPGNFRCAENFFKIAQAN